MAQFVSCRAFFTEIRVRTRAILCEICGGQNGTRISFCSNNFVLHRNSVYVYIVTLLLSGREADEGSEIRSAALPFKK